MSYWLSLLMSDEKHNENLLVDQNEALDFYFDSLLLSDENDFSLDDIEKEHNAIEKNATGKPALQDDIKKHNSQDINSQNKIDQTASIEQMQSAKAFLQLSRQRQQIKTEHIVVNDVQPESDAKPELTPDSEVPQKAELPITKKSKVITKGPLSPKPRERESRATELVSKKSESKASIVFSKKNDDGRVIDQVLIPRSQKLASLKPMNKSRVSSKSISGNSSKEEIKTSIEVPEKSENSTQETKESVSQAAPLEKEYTPEPKVTADIHEAPNLDLSLFLPKIKTLSDTEIAQQIEALTQAAVSQAQLESDLVHVAQLEQVSQQVIKTAQVESDDGPIRNVENAPSWAVPNFQVLLFTVAGLKMAVPLNELNGIVEWGEEYITELPGHKSWYLGIIQNQGKNVPVIDTLQQVVPQNRWPAEYLNEKNFKHIILIDDSRWGLACETVLEVVTLKTDSVKWRSSRTKRRWLLGTVIEHMCALLDSTEFAAMLKTGDDSLIS